MTAVRRIAALARYSWIGAWRRYIVVLGPALFLLVLFSQFPRLEIVRQRLLAQPGSTESLGTYASFIGDSYGILWFNGMFLALGMGAAGTGSRRLAGHVLPILARPISRTEFVLGRFIAYGGTLGLYWLVPALTHEILRASLDVPLRTSIASYVAPLLTHLILLSLGLAMGTMLPAIPATFAGSFLTVMVLTYGDTAAGGPLRHSVARVLAWFVPPLNDLSRLAVPFASAASLRANAALFVQGVAWIAIFLAIAAIGIERSDFTPRS